MAAQRPIRRYLRLVLAFGGPLLPILLILLLPMVAGWDDALPLVVQPENEVSDAPEVLADLSSDMNSIAIGVIVAAAVLLREWRGRRSRLFWVAAIAVFSCATSSCYAGFRFRFGLAEQILVTRVDLDLIGDRLAVQGLLLLASLSALVYMALLSFTGKPDPRRRRRPRKAAGSDGD